jgi:hypothetical protein
MLRQVNEFPDKCDNKLVSRLRDAVVPKNTGFFLIEGLLFICVPEWEGWKYINHEKYESVDHFARWEVFFYPRDERFWIFLRITWPSVTQILLGFIYPDDRKLLEEIVLHRRLALLDRPLTEGLPHPLSSGIIIHDIPVDVLMALGIDSKDGKKSIN